MPILLCYLWTRAKGFIKTADSVNPLFPLPRTPPPIISEWCSSPGLELKAKGSKWSSKKSASGRIFLKSYCHYFLNIYASISIYFRCGGSVQLDRDTNSFEFSSPNYPQVPPAHAECIWVVMAPQGKRIQLDFTDNFRIRRSGGWDVLSNAVISSCVSKFLFLHCHFSFERCRDEGVELRDGGTANSDLIDTFCRSIPQSQRSTGNFLYIRYYSNTDTPNIGFKASVKISELGVIKSSTWHGENLYLTNNYDYFRHLRRRVLCLSRRCATDWVSRTPRKLWARPWLRVAADWPSRSLSQIWICWIWPTSGI